MATLGKKKKKKWPTKKHGRLAFFFSNISTTNEEGLENEILSDLDLTLTLE